MLGLELAKRLLVLRELTTMSKGEDMAVQSEERSRRGEKSEGLMPRRRPLTRRGSMAAAGAGHCLAGPGRACRRRPRAVATATTTAPRSLNIYMHNPPPPSASPPRPPPPPYPAPCAVAGQERDAVCRLRGATSPRPTTPI